MIANLNQEESWGVNMGKGLVQVYTGAGKGKTTAALGLALRAIGHRKKVHMIQFLKKSFSGELKSREYFGDQFVIEQFGKDENLCLKKNITEEDRQAALSGTKQASEIMREKKCDVLILDEVNVAISSGILNVVEVLELIKGKPDDMELILTGRNAPDEIINVADLVTEMVNVKHPFKRGIQAREGIEY